MLLVIKLIGAQLRNIVKTMSLSVVGQKFQSRYSQNCYFAVCLKRFILVFNTTMRSVATTHVYRCRNVCRACTFQAVAVASVE